MLYEELKGCRKNPLQERLCLLVHVRRQVLDVQRLEVLALGMSNEDNAKSLNAALDSYRRKMFGKLPKPEDAWVEQAKKALAEEAKKAYIVTPKKGKGADFAALQAQATSSNPEVARMAQHLLKEEVRAKARLLRGKKGEAKPPPPGVITERR